MTDYVQAGVSLIADVSDAESKIQDLLDMVSVFDSPITVDVSADIPDIGSEITDAIPDSETVDIAADTSSIGTDISDAVPDSEDVAITPTIDDKGQSILDTLKAIEAVTLLNLVIDVGGSVISFLSSWADFTAGPLLAIDTGMAEFQARTGAALPNARELITKILGEDLATGVTQITSVLTTAQQLHLPLEEAATSALTFTKVFPDNNPNTVLTTLDSMVKNNLVPDLTAGSDLLVAGFQQGANKGGDLLSVLGRNSSALKDLGLTGPSSLQLISNALAGGAADATSVVTALEKIKTNIMLQTTSGKGGALDTLKALNIPNPITSGQGWSADFFTAVSDAIKNAPVDDATKQQMFTSLVGGKLSQKDYQGFLNIDAAQGAFDNLKDTGKNAATVMDNSLSGAIDDFVTAAQVAATNFLSSDQIDLPGKMAALKTGLQDALNVLATGGDLGQALTVALKPIGFDDEFQSLESALGNFVIGILQAVASIQDLTGHGKEATGTRATIASMAQNQLAFDLKVANPDQVAADISTAVGRGVTPKGIADAVGTAASELIKSGATTQAQNLIDSLKDQANQVPATVQAFIDQNKVDWSSGVSIDQQFAAAQAAQQALIDKASDLQKQIDDAQANAIKSNFTETGSTLSQGGHTLGIGAGGGLNTNPAPDFVASAVAVADLGTKATALGTASDLATQGVAHQTKATSDANTATATLTGTINNVVSPSAHAATSVNALNNAITPIPGHVAPATMSVIGLNNTLPTLNANLVNANSNLTILSDTAASLAAAGTPPSGAKPGKGHASGTEDTGGVGFWAGENGPEFITSDRSLAVLNNKTMSAIMAAVSGAAGRGGVSNSNSSKTVNLTQINTVPNQAAADALGYSTAQQIRGM